MKTIGLVGGTGWVSSAEYYKLINQYSNRILGGLDTARIILYSVNYGDIDRINRTGSPEEVFEIIVSAAGAIEQAGAGCLLLCANTMHQFAPRLSEKIRIPLIHIGEATAKEVVRQGMKKVGLLGTLYTMEMDFYHSKLRELGVISIVPEKEDRDFIHQTIMKELLVENFKPESKQRFLRIIDDLKKQGAEGIILGCTEIPLLIKPGDTEIPLFNTTEIHAKSAVDFALESIRPVN